MQNYEVGITGGGNVPNKPESNGENGTISEREKNLVIKQQLIDKLSGKAKEAVNAVAEDTIGAAMGFVAAQQTIDAAEAEIEADMEARQARAEANRQQIAEMNQIKEVNKRNEAEVEKMAPRYVDVDYSGETGPVPLKEPAQDTVQTADAPEHEMNPESYYNSLIEENGGEPLTRSQIKAKYHELKKERTEMRCDGSFTGEQRYEYDMKKHVLKDMLHGKSFVNTKIDGDPPKDEPLPQPQQAESGPAPIQVKDPHPVAPKTPDNGEFGLKEPEFYAKQFIEENGGEPLTRSQIKDKIKAIKAELKSDNVMTDVEYQELQMQRNVLIDMLHGETY